MRTLSKRVLDAVLHPLGLNIERYFGADLALKRLVSQAKGGSIDLLLDVGANKGQYAKKMIDLGFDQPIVSFEPLSAAYATLTQNAASCSNWYVFERCAIGDADDNIQINISENSHSSSILEVDQLHTRAAPSAAYVDKELVRVRKLDSISDQLSGDRVLLKIDTQGYEDRVLRGAMNKLLPRVKIIQLEISLLPLYRGSMTIEDMLPFLRNLGFQPAYYSPGFLDRTRGEMQQLEGIFIRQEA